MEQLCAPHRMSAQPIHLIFIVSEARAVLK